MAIYIGNQKVSLKGGLEVSGFTIPVFTGDLSYQFYNERWNWFIEEYGDKIVTQDVTHCQNMFYGSSKLKNIPFEINCKSGQMITCASMFYNTGITSVPKINNCKPENTNQMFYSCIYLRYFPEDFESWFDWSYMETQGNVYSSTFRSCYSLRKLPLSIFNHAYPKATYSNAFYNHMAQSCYCLDEIVDLPIPFTSTWTSNVFSFTFLSCSRAKNITFALQENGQPYVMSWKSQTIDLGSYVGFSVDKILVVNYNSGITYETRITDDATYQLYKNHPDSWTTDIAYSRYNHDSAVATINSLPDTSAYITANGGTNTIKFKGASGSLTDGGAINTLTEEEIAVATAKGWTVTFA